MPKVEKLNALVGGYVNLAYPLPSGASVKFLNDQTTYLGNQLESEFDGDRCFGILANMDFIMVCTTKLKSNASITHINALKLWEQNATLDSPNYRSS